GLRIEDYEQDRFDRRLAPPQNNQAATSNTEYMPGVGFTWFVLPQAQVFGSVYKAFSPALNSDALNGLQDQQLDAERSVNVELGLRGAMDRFSYELALFSMDFDNQIIPANSNTQFQTTNGGETVHRGLEFGVNLELGGGFAVNANATWVRDAEFVGARFDRN